MRPRTISTTFPKEVAARCIRDDRFDDLDIHSRCFWLGILYEGCVRLEVAGQLVDAISPCFLCFDERHTPRVVSRRHVRCDSVYFDPTFINVNMTYDRIHETHYEEIAARHDFFLMKPFTDPNGCVVPLFEESIGNAKRLFGGMEQEFLCQRDWYWSCRSRSYFMELLFLLERNYGCMDTEIVEGETMHVQNSYLKRALIYIENHYTEHLSLSDITHGAGLNHTTLTVLFKAETGMTPMEYLWHHRIAVARRQLEFTGLPIKDIAARCGFQTVQHFCRKFEEQVGMTPGGFRQQRYRQRVTELGQTQGCRAGRMSCSEFDA